MFPSKKSLAAAFSFLLLSQQIVSAFPIAAALQRDAVRFHQVKEEQEEVQLQAVALQRLEKFNKKTDASWQIRMNARTGTPRALVNGRDLRVGRSESAALSFIKSNKDFLGVDRSQLKLKLQRKSPIGMHFYFDQYYKGLKVENAYVKVNVDTKGNLLNYQSTFVDNLDINTTPEKTAFEAAAIAAADASGKPEGSVRSIIYSDKNSGRAVLAWQVTILGGISEPGKWIYFIDAANGSVLNRISRYMNATETYQAELFPVYPGFIGQPKKTFPIPNLNVYYLDGMNTPISAKTNALGQVDVTRTGRAFTTFSGDFFTVTDQRQFTNPSGYYVETGLDATNKKENIDTSFSAWTDFAASASPVATYNACIDPGSWPVFATPKFAANFSVGKMDNSGVIENKIFLNLNITGSPAVLANYIGRSTDVFDGPIVPNLSTTQTLTYGLNPSALNQTYEVSTMSKICVPSAFAATFNPVTTHNLSGINNNDAIANAFYNLNVMKGYFDGLNGGYINLNNHIPVMINAYGQPYPFGSSGMINAFYDIDQNTILFGQGILGESVYNTFALENAVVRHEYVHAVMNNIWPVLYFDEGAAIAEAVSDYFALSSLVDPLTGQPFTSQIGKYVSANLGISGEGSVRDLAGSAQFDPATWVQNMINGQHENSLVLSQALWQLRIDPATSARADALVWNSLMFFPDSLLEFRDAMLSVAKAKSAQWGTDYSSNIETAFDAHKINYETIITANGDIYEPNNGPESAADLDASSISSKVLNATINPASDVDYYSVSLGEGDFEVTMHLPVAPNYSPTAYLPLTMFLLDANLKTVVDFISPELSSSQFNIITNSESITLKYTVPALLNGGTGRYLLGVSKHIQGFYPLNPTATTGAYILNFKFSKGSTVGGVDTVVDNFEDGLLLNYNVNYNVAGKVADVTLIPPALAAWSPNNIEEYYSARLLDESMLPITGADTVTNTYLSEDGAPTVDEVNKTITGKVKVGANFSALGYNTIYLQIFAKLRTSVSGEGTTDKREDYGIVSLGISNPIRSKAGTGKDIYMKRSIFNPMDGSKIKIEINPKESGNIKLQIFTVDGLLVKTVFSGSVTKDLPEYYEWDGRNGDGQMVASGVYLLRTDGAGIDKQLKKIVVVK